MDKAQGRAVGIGGLFIRATDPSALAEWYRDMLGIVAARAGEPDPDGNWMWRQEAGDTVVSAFPEASDYWPVDRRVMINFRVEGLDALIARCEARGHPVETRAEWNHPKIGRFARVHDPEGNPVELWEPPSA